MDPDSQENGHVQTTEELYEVENILDVRTVNNVKQYLVRWVGWSPKWDSWEPEDNLLSSCQDLIENFLNSQQQQQQEQEQEQPQSPDVSSTEPNSIPETDERIVEKKQRRRSQKRQFWEYVSEEEAEKLRDPFWKKVEEGKIEFTTTNDLYERVKRGRRGNKVEDVVPKKRGRGRPRKTAQNPAAMESRSSKSTLGSVETSNISSESCQENSLYRDESLSNGIIDAVVRDVRKAAQKRALARSEDEKSEQEDEEEEEQQEYIQKKIASLTRAENLSVASNEDENCNHEDDRFIHEAEQRRYEDNPPVVEGEYTVETLEVPPSISNGCEKSNGCENSILLQFNAMIEEKDCIDDKTIPDEGDYEEMEIVDTTEYLDDDSPGDEETELRAENGDSVVGVTAAEDEEASMTADQSLDKNIKQAEASTTADQSLDENTKQVEQKKKEEKVEKEKKTDENAQRKEKETTEEKKGTAQPTKLQSPSSNGPLRGQWLPLKRADPKAVKESLKQTPPTDHSTSNGAPSTSTDAINTSNLDTAESLLMPPPSESSLETGIEELALEGLPLPVSINLSVGEFFKGELRNGQQTSTPSGRTFEFSELLDACCSGDVEGVRTALSTTKQPNTSSLDLNKRVAISGCTVVMNVCDLPCDPTHKLDDIIELLASYGANLNARNHFGDTALTMTISKNYVCKVTKLVSLGAAINLPNRQGETPLMFACKRNLVKIVHRLLDYGADFNAETAEGKTALDFAKEIAETSGNNSCELAVRHRGDKVVQTFRQQLRLVLPPEQFDIRRPLFPLHCYALNESNAFRIVFQFDQPPPQEEPIIDLQYLLAIAKGRFMSSEKAEIRFWGSTPVKSVTLNSVPQASLTSEGRFLYSLSPIENGLNDLVITCNTDCKQSQLKLLIEAYSISVIQQHQPQQLNEVYSFSPMEA